MANGDVRFTVTHHGYNELRQKLRSSEDWIGEPYRKSFQTMGQVGQQSVQAGAPIGTPSGNYRPGQTVLNVFPVVSKSKIPRFVRIEERARRDGVAYPRILEFSPYAQNRYRKGHNRHRDWMRKAIERVVPVFERLLDMAADGVVQNWTKG